jgi:hypothetical protein
LLGWFPHDFVIGWTLDHRLETLTLSDLLGLGSAKREFIRSTTDELDSTRHALVGQCRNLVQAVWMSVENKTITS